MQVYMLKAEGIAFRFLPDPLQIKNALEVCSLIDFSLIALLAYIYLGLFIIYSLPSPYDVRRLQLLLQQQYNNCCFNYYFTFLLFYYKYRDGTCMSTSPYLVIKCRNIDFLGFIGLQWFDCGNVANHVITRVLAIFP